MIYPAFAKILSQYPIRRVNGAFEKWMETNDRMPTPSDIIKVMPGPLTKMIPLTDEIGDKYPWRGRHNNQILVYEDEPEFYTYGA